GGGGRNPTTPPIERHRTRSVIPAAPTRLSCHGAATTTATTTVAASGTFRQQLNALPVNLIKAQCVKHKSPESLSRGPPGQQHLIDGITDSALHILPAVRGRGNQ
ncbi:MAG TPA: hypothetical protein VFQ48_08090, partial [Pseudonocardiaceae bacterium]|nr:hypothetical protein [Pseudonocardiaceae bacterium]